MDVDEVLQFVENVADFIPKSQIDCLSVVGREDVGDIVIFLDKKETKNEDLWQALYAHQSPAVNSAASISLTADSEASNNTCNVLLGTKRSWSEIADCYEPLDLGLESQTSPICSPIQSISQQELCSSGTPEKKRKVESMLPDQVAEVYEGSLEEDEDGPPVQEQRMSVDKQAPKSILKSRPSGKKASVVFKDTVTLVTHSYVIEGDESRLDQSEEDMSRFEYEGKDRTSAPFEEEASMADASDSDDGSVSRELFASPYQYSSCVVSSVSSTPSGDSQLAQSAEETLPACDVKKVLFPQEEHAAMAEPVLERTRVTSDTPMVRNAAEMGTSTEVDSPTLVESSFFASELDTSFLSESDLTDDMLMDALHESSTSQSASSGIAGPAQPVTVAAAPPFVPPMSFYSQDLMLDSSPTNSASQENASLSRPSTTVSTTPVLAKTLPSTAAQSPGPTLSIYQSFSQDSPSQPGQIAPDLGDTSSDTNDPLQLKAWPAVLWARTKTFLPAPHLIRTSPDQGTIVYLVQKNFRFDDNLALQAAMIASQTLNMPLVVVMLADQDLLEDLGHTMEQTPSMPATPHSVAAMSTPYLAKGLTTPAVGSLKVEKTAPTSGTAAQGALRQKSIARLQAMDGLRLACERHGIPVHVFQYSSVVRYESTTAATPCPKALAAQSMVAQLFDNSTQFLSLLFTDDFMHPYTRNMVATLTTANTQLPVFCVESSTMAAPNMSLPLLDADAAVAQAAVPKYSSLNEWATPRCRWMQTVDEQVEHHRQQLDELQQEDALSRLDSLDGRVHPPTKGLMDFADELNEWRLVSAQPSDKASAWSLAAQKELQERHSARLCSDSMRSPHSRAASTLISVAQRCEWTEVVSRLFKETLPCGEPFRSVSDPSGERFQTPGTPAERDASPWPFAAATVRVQLRHLVDSVSAPRAGAATGDCSADAIAYFHAAYQLGVLSPIDCRALASAAHTRGPTSTATGAPHEAIRQATQRIVALCREDDYAQLTLYDSRLVQCVTTVHRAPKTPARGGSTPAMPTITASVSWLQTLPLETLTFLFFDKSTTGIRGAPSASSGCHLQELRSLWKPFLGPTSTIALPTFEKDLGPTETHSAAGWSCSRELQWWILSYLLRSPSIAAGVNTAFRHFLLRRTYAPTDEHLAPCVFLLALMELPSRIQNLLVHEPVLGTVHGLQSLLQQRIAQSMAPSLLPFIHEHFLRLDDPR